MVKRINTWRNALATGKAVLDVGDGIEIELPTSGNFGGAAGPPGAGVPAGGSALQVIRKTEAGDTTEWVTPDKTMVGLSNVNNTADADKPVSAPQATALGGKVAKGELFLNAKDYGAIGDGVADDTAALQAWLTAGGIRLFGGTYRITAGLTLAGNGRRLYTDNATIRADGLGIDVLTATGDDVDISVTIDGLNKARYGVKTTGARPRITRCRIENLSSTGSTARGIECTTGTGATITGNVIRNIFATGDTTFGNSNGMSRAIVITNTAAATGGTLISDNFIDGVTGEEGDAIAVLFSDGVATTYLQCRTVIEKNVIRNASRRFIKVQGSGCKVRNNVLEHDGAAPVYPSNAIDFINSAGATITGNEIGDHPLGTTISVVGEVDRIATGAVIANNLIRLSDTKTNTTVFLNYTQDCSILGNTVYGGGRGFAAGYCTALVMDGNTHFGGVAASKSFEANGTNTNVVMRKNLNMNKARTSYLSNTSVGPISDLNATLI